MKNSFLTASLVLNVIFAGFIGHYILQEQENVQVKPLPTDTIISTTTNQTKLFKIAIFVPTTHPSLEKIEAGFREGLVHKYGLNCSFDIYNANGNPTLMHAQAEEIMQKDYDLIYTIGAMTTQMAKEISIKKQKSTPIVFGVVARPQNLNLIKSLDSSGNHLTGLSADPDYELQMTMLHFLKPDIKRILLVYDPTQSSGLEYDKQVTEKILNRLGIELATLEIYKSNEVYGKVSSMLNNVDAVLIFKDNTVVSSIDSLIKLCNRAGVPLCTTELDSVPKGAVIGFSISSYDSGVESAEKAYTILAEGKHPSQVPITQAKNFKIMINEKSMEPQRFVLNSQLKQLISSVEVIR